jgi:hypothetical protein
MDYSAEQTASCARRYRREDRPEASALLREWKPPRSHPAKEITSHHGDPGMFSVVIGILATSPTMEKRLLSQKCNTLTSALTQPGSLLPDETPLETMRRSLPRHDAARFRWAAMCIGPAR